MQFLMEGARRGEPVLYVTLSETAEELKSVGESHGWDMSGVSIRELLPPDGALESDEQYTMYHPSEVELAATTKSILEDVQRLKPTRRGVRLAYRSCAWWPATRCAIGGRFSRSSSTSPAGNAPSFCSTT